jgi:hypothetical protein
MKAILTRRMTDGFETMVHAGLGLAAVLALALFLVSLVRVSDQAPQIARALERISGGPAGVLVAGGLTNSSSAVTKRSRAPAASLPRGGATALPARAVGVRPAADG